MEEFTKSRNKLEQARRALTGHKRERQAVTRNGRGGARADAAVVYGAASTRQRGEADETRRARRIDSSQPEAQNKRVRARAAMGARGDKSEEDTDFFCSSKPPT